MSTGLPPPNEEINIPFPQNTPMVTSQGNVWWKRPDSAIRIERVFRDVRDHDLSYLRVLLETQLGSSLSIDGSGDGLVELDWDRCITPHLTWSDALGIIGPGMVLSLKSKPIAMIQIGAAEVDMETYSMIPETWFIEKFVPRDSRSGFILTQRNYFLTWGALRDFGDPDFVRGITPDARLWYQVTFPCLEFALQRLVQRTAK